MRVAVGIHKSDIAAAIETYNLMSQKFFTHARFLSYVLVHSRGCQKYVHMYVLPSACMR